MEMSENIKFERLIAISRTLKILYIEDNEDNSQQSVTLLENFFFDIMRVSNIDEGLSKFQENFYDIVFIDIQMPLLDGISMAKEMKKQKKDIPIVVLSSYNEVKYLLEIINNDIDGYILKPYDYEKTYEVVSKIIRKYYNRDIIQLAYNYFWNQHNKILTLYTKPIKLTINEIKLFECLIKSLNSFVSNEDLEYYIFEDTITNNKRVRNVISRLKNKIDNNLIESQYGLGYKIKLQS